MASQQREIIGKGSFGNVYLHNSNQVVKRVKLIENYDENDPNSQTQIVYSTIRELSFLTCFKHPNIANLTYFKMCNKDVEIGLEHGGISLADWMQEHGTKRKACVLPVIMFQLLKVLHFLEVNGIVHSDIKPSNIVIDKDLNVRLIDWGGVCFKGAKNSVSLCSTRTFKAPEQRSEITKTLETGCFNDIFSLGMTLFTVLFNKQPDKKLHIKKHSKYIDVLKVYDVDLEDFCKLDDMHFSRLLLSTLQINHKKRAKASELIYSDVFKSFRDAENYKDPEEVSMNYKFINKTIGDATFVNFFQKKLEEIIDTFNINSYSVYANMLFQMIISNYNTNKLIRTKKDFDIFLPHFCIDLCIILFDDLKDSKYYDFDEYDLYFEIRDNMMKTLLPELKFDIYRKL